MINRTVLVGRMVKDAEVKKTQSGMSVCNFTIAVQEKETDFIDCVAWNKSADFMVYCKKGDIVGVDGKIKTRTYERDGHKNKVYEVIADRVRKIYGKREENTDDWASALKEAEIGSEELPF